LPRYRRGRGAEHHAIERLEDRLVLSAWYVSASLGNDANPGTLAQPFQSIQQAANVAQAGDTVFIRAGVYRQTIVPRNSGAPGRPIVYEPYQNEQVTLDGADPLSGWSLYQGSTYRTSLPWDMGDGQNQLFFNGQMMNEARWPNSSLDPSNPTFSNVSSAQVLSNNGTSATATIGVSLADPAGAWVGATIHISPGATWVTQTGTVTASSPGSLTYQYQPLTTYEAPAAGNHFYLTGLFRALDSADEWYRDSGGNLYFWAPQNANPTSGVVEAKHRLYAFDLSGSSNIDIIGLNLFACTINTDAGSSNDRIEGIDAQYLSQQMTISNPWALQYLPQTTGIIFNGANDLLQNSTIDYSSGCGVFLGGAGDAVQNCVIANTDYAAAEMAGIYVLGANAQATGNTVFNCGRSGIVVRVAPGAMIMHNVVHDVGLQETDLGGIYTFNTNGQGARFAYNDVYNVHTGGYGAAGIFLDNNSANFVVDHNLAWNCDFALKMNPVCSNDLICNNTLAGTQDSVASSGNFDMSGSVFSNDIFTAAVQIATDATQSHDQYNAASSQFVNAAAGNYQLVSSSPAINAGMPIPPYTEGYIGSGPDQGAYEYGTAAWTAGSSLPVLGAPAAPSAPGNPTAAVNSPASVSLSWAVSSGAVTAYHVERSSDGGASFTDIADDVQGTGYTDTSARAGTSYLYRVRAENAGAFSSYSSAVPVTTPLPMSEVVTASPGAGGITLKQDADHRHIDWTLGATTAWVAINDPNGLTIYGDGGNDLLTLDDTNGNPLPNTLHLNGTFTINNLQGTNPLVGTTLDIGRSTVFISYANPAADPIAAIKQYLQTAFNAAGSGGHWNGVATASTGVITSAPAQANPAQNTGIGYADSADGTGVNITPNTIELKYTLDGDANLSGNVDSADLQLLLTNLNRTGSWDQGDFNYDGQVNSADLQLLLATLNTTLGSQIAAATNALAAPAFIQPENSQDKTPVPSFAAAPAAPTPMILAPNSRKSHAPRPMHHH
jgi:hypothetical protein